MQYTRSLMYIGFFASMAAACAAPEVQPPATEPSITRSEKPAPKAFNDSVSRSELRERAIGVVTQLASSPNAELRANAVEASAWAPKRLEAVIASGLKDENAGVRAVAAVAAGKAGIKSLAPAIEPMLRDPSPYVLASAIYGLVKLGRDVDQTPLATLLLQSRDLRVRSHTALVLGDIGNTSAVGLLRHAARESVPNAEPGVQTLLDLQIAQSLARLNDRSGVETLRAALYPSRPEELEGAVVAIQMLGELKERSTADQLIYISETKDETGQPISAEIRLAAAGSLGRMGMKQGGFIAEEFWTDARPTLRAQSAFVFGVVGDSVALSRLDTLLNDPEDRVRVAAARGILEALGTR